MLLFKHHNQLDQSPTSAPFPTLWTATYSKSLRSIECNVIGKGAQYIQCNLTSTARIHLHSRNKALTMSRQGRLRQKSSLFKPPSVSLSGILTGRHWGHALEHHVTSSQSYSWSFLVLQNWSVKETAPSCSCYNLFSDVAAAVNDVKANIFFPNRVTHLLIIYRKKVSSKLKPSKASTKGERVIWRPTAWNK